MINHKVIKRTEMSLFIYAVTHVDVCDINFLYVQFDKSKKEKNHLKLVIKGRVFNQERTAFCIFESACKLHGECNDFCFICFYGMLITYNHFLQFEQRHFIDNVQFASKKNVPFSL